MCTHYIYTCYIIYNDADINFDADNNKIYLFSVFKYKKCKFHFACFTENFVLVKLHEICIFIVCCKDYFCCIAAIFIVNLFYFLFAVFFSEFFEFALVCFLLFFVYEVAFYLVCYFVIFRYFAFVFVVYPDKMIAKLCFYRPDYFI